jgi:multidrug efflux pump subunit AcrA (membrane-fusion protein)
MSDKITELLYHTFVRAALGVVALIVTGTGAVSPVENPDLSFAVGGKVAAVNVAVGDTVTEGQLLANLDTGVLGANLAAAEANYAGRYCRPARCGSRR